MNIRRWFMQNVKGITESSICKENDFNRLEKYISMLPTLQQVYPQFMIPEGIVHRKIWEWAFIIETLMDNNMLQPGKLGLGFAVGNEPLPSLFAGGGCQIVASDYWEDEDNLWVKTGQNLQGKIGDLNQYGLCSEEFFKRNVIMRKIDMNVIPYDLSGFDFCWSSCAVEHLGNLELGKAFFQNHLRVLKPGGIAVHTIEFNNSSNTDTIEEGDTVIFRQRDLQDIEKRLKNIGCKVNCNFVRGEQEGDFFVDQPPYYAINPKYHLHLNIGGYDCTSYGLIIKKK